MLTKRASVFPAESMAGETSPQRQSRVQGEHTTRSLDLDLRAWQELCIRQTRAVICKCISTHMAVPT